jgi:hypothetical protein
MQCRAVFLGVGNAPRSFEVAMSSELHRVLHNSLSSDNNTRIAAELHLSEITTDPRESQLLVSNRRLLSCRVKRQL